MRFDQESTSVFVYLSPTTGCLLAPFPRVKRRSRLLKSFLKSQVKFLPSVVNKSLFCLRSILNVFCFVFSPEGLSDVILYHQPDDKKKNRGFCFLEYEDHKTAAQARRRLMSGKVKVWGNLVTVEWADPIEDPDPEVMAKVNDGPSLMAECCCLSRYLYSCQVLMLFHSNTYWFPLV